jgi:hypothetical protein
MAGPSTFLLHRLLAVTTASLSLGAPSPVPVPAGWNYDPGVAICKGQMLRPLCPASCVNISSKLPFHNECLWPLKRTGFVDGAYSVTECTKMHDCVAVTCGPAFPMAGIYCGARSQFEDTCTVPGQIYNSFIHGPAPPGPPPLPPFRLGQIFADHMVLQAGAAGAAVSGFAPPGAIVLGGIDGLGGGSATTADATGLWQMVLHSPATTESSRPQSNYTLTFTSVSHAPLVIRDVVWGDVWVCE